MIKEYAQLIGRTPAALNLKIGNLGSFDPVLKEKGITGLAHTSKMDEDIWNEFWDNPEKLAYESEKIISELKHQSIEESTIVDLSDFPEGIERTAFVRQRVNQQFFRDAVLCSYENRCCITGVNIPSLLEACHISSWKDDVKNRTNPKNGLCMNILFHRAFDKYLMTVTPDYNILISDQMIDGTQEEVFRNYLQKLTGTPIRLPEKFSPDKEFLSRHYERYKNEQ
mgnify:CR=1 FL=1